MEAIDVVGNICRIYLGGDQDQGDSRNKTRSAKVVVVANSKQKVFSWTQKAVKYTPKNFGFDYTLYCPLT